MAYPTSITDSYTTALSATLARRVKGWDSIVRSAIVFLGMLKKKSLETIDGGRRIEWPFHYMWDTSEHSYGYLEGGTFRERDHITIAYAYLKKYRSDWMVRLDDVQDNRGTHRLFNLLDQAEEESREAMTRAINDDLVNGDGTGNDSKKLTGLLAMCPTTVTTGTYCGINRAQITAWRPQRVYTNDAYYTTDNNLVIPTQMDDLDHLMLLCSQQASGSGAEMKPDLLLCTTGYWELWKKLANRKGTLVFYADDRAAQLGFESAKFNGSTLVYDRMMDDLSESNHHCYALNTKYVRWATHSERNFVSTPVIDLRNTTRQDALAAGIEFRGELYNRNPATSGLQYGVRES